MTEPHSLFTIWRADEVAECLEGVDESLYARLWTIATMQKRIPNLEDTGPADHVGFECLANHWSMLTPSEQSELNRLAGEQDKRYGWVD